MTPDNSQRRIGRSIFAVIAGMVIGTALQLGTDALMHAIGVFPAIGTPMNDRLLAIATAYRAIYFVLGAYIVAALAPYRPLLHAMVSGFIGLVLGVMGAAATWNRDLGPHWYPIALIVLALPTAGVAGWLREQQLKNRDADHAHAATAP